MLTTTVGSYPKVTDQPNPDDLPGAWHRLDQGKITREALEAILRKNTARVLREQEEAGIDILTDGQLWWDDPVSPFARQVTGVEVNGLTRYFNNNIYYRRTIIHKTPAFKGSFAAPRYREAMALTSRPVRAVLTGPVTWASLAENRQRGGSVEKLANQFAETLRSEVQALRKAGCRTIQVDEPAVACEPSLIRVAQKVLPKLVSRDGLSASRSFGQAGVQWWLYLYFGDVTKIAKPLARLPFDVFGLDLVEGPKLINALAAFEGKAVALGVLDGRNTKLEDEAALANTFERAAKQIPTDSLYASPNCGLEFLPHTQAQRKMARLASAVRRFENGARHHFSSEGP